MFNICAHSTCKKYIYILLCVYTNMTVCVVFQFASVEVIVTTIQDHFSPQVKKYLKRKEILVVIVCLVSFLCGLPNMTQVTKLMIRIWLFKALLA